MQQYEIAYLVSMSENWHVTALFKDVEALVLNSKGRVHRHESWGKRQLAFKIRNSRSAFFYCLYFECKVGLLNQIQEKFRTCQRVLRHLVIRRDAKPRPRRKMLSNRSLAKSG